MLLCITCQNTADFQSGVEGSSIKGMRLVPLEKKCIIHLNKMVPVGVEYLAFFFVFFVYFLL